jgi:mono/diheme cytochrome c family protein
MENRRAAEYFIMAMAIGLGVPVFALLGAQEGGKEAAVAYPAAREAPAPIAVDYAGMVLASAAGVEKGRELFQRNCTACHGAHGDGKGPAASALTPAPRDFLDPKAKWTRGRGPLQIYQTLTEGNPGTAMPPFGAALSVPDRWALVHYLGSLPGVKDQFEPLDAVAASQWKP